MINCLNHPSSNLQLQALLEQETLIDKTATFESFKNFENQSIRGHIFFGTGISRPGEIATELPMDFLIYPLVALKVRAAVPGSHIHHLVADEHALLNQFDEKTCRRAGKAFRKKFENVVDALGIENYHVYLASEIATDNKYKKILCLLNTKQFSSSYARLEAADIRYFFETRNIGYKLSWKFKNNGRLDEMSFDDQYQSVFGKNIINIYTSSGRKFTDGMNEAVPYTVSTDDSEKRLIISGVEDIVKKVQAQHCSEQTLSSLQKHYKSLVRLYETTIKRLPQNAVSTWEKMNQINQIISN